jgi:hypothetical protein
MFPSGEIPFALAAVETFPAATCPELACGEPVEPVETFPTVAVVFCALPTPIPPAHATTTIKITPNRLRKG